MDWALPHRQPIATTPPPRWTRLRSGRSLRRLSSPALWLRRGATVGVLATCGLVVWWQAPGALTIGRSMVQGTEFRTEPAQPARHAAATPATAPIGTALTSNTTSQTATTGQQLPAPTAAAASAPVTADPVAPTTAISSTNATTSAVTTGAGATNAQTDSRADGATIALPTAVPVPTRAVMQSPTALPEGRNTNLSRTSTGTSGAGNTSSTVGATTSSTAGTVVHTIESGDTLFGLARQYNTTIEAIVALNHLADPNALSIGTRLLIPR